GAIEIRSDSDQADHDVSVAEANQPLWQATLPSGGRIRSIFATTFWAPNELRVKVAGYPDKTAQLYPWSRLKYRVPESFLRPVILLKPSGPLIQMLKNNPMKIEITANGTKVQRSFDGYSLWIGCDNDVAVPFRLQDSWRGETKDYDI